MHQVYSHYLTKAFEQYQEQSAKVVQRGQFIKSHPAEKAEDGNEGVRARH
jgi:hypothetical protein